MKIQQQSKITEKIIQGVPILLVAKPTTVEVRAPFLSFPWALLHTFLSQTLLCATIQATKISSSPSLKNRKTLLVQKTLLCSSTGGKGNNSHIETRRALSTKSYYSKFARVFWSSQNKVSWHNHATKRLNNLLLCASLTYNNHLQFCCFCR